MSVCGIDFGTTNTSVALVEGDGSVRVVPIDPEADNPQTLRSVIYFDDEHFTFGAQAIRKYIASNFQGRLIQSVKGLLSSEYFTGTRLGRKLMRAEDLVAMILREIRRRVEVNHGRSLDSVVLGRPVTFSGSVEADKLAEERMRVAAKLAGFTEIHLQFEPVAAALEYERSLGQQAEKLALVGDFGGGTSDFTVVRCRHGARDRQKDILSLGGLAIGGDTFSGEILRAKCLEYFGADTKYLSPREEWLPVPRHYFLTLCTWYLIPFLRERKTREGIRQIRARADQPKLIEHLEELIDDNSGFALYQAIEATKYALSEQQAAAINFRSGGLQLQQPVSRSDFETTLEKHLTLIRKKVAEVLNQAGVTTQQIDAVFLTGGSSKIPAIQALFRELFGEDCLAEGDAFTSIVAGLGLQAATL